MAIIRTDAWQCDVCAHVWLRVQGFTPTHCPNRECRSRRWNGGVSRAEARRFETNFAPPAKDEPIGKEAMTGLMEDARKFIATGKHYATCKCLMCKPPKPQAKSS